jgi:hypothetical protein
MNSDPLTESGRAAPDVDCDVESFAPGDPYELSLRLLDLEVHPAERVAPGVTMIVLDESGRDARGGKLVLAPALKEKAASILKYSGLDQDHFR